MRTGSTIRLKPMSTLTPETPKQLPNTIQKARVGKNDARHWLPRLYRPVNAQGKASPHYAMQLQFKGHRLAFGLRTSNREAAARRAAGIYGDLVSFGVEETLAKPGRGGLRLKASRRWGDTLRPLKASWMSARRVSRLTPVICGGSQVTSLGCVHLARRRPERSGRQGNP